MPDTSERGLILVNTGDGKGKTTAAFGQLIRAFGAGLSCVAIQFIKRDISSEVALLQKSFPEIKIHITGLGFTWDSTDLSQDTKAAQDGWKLAKSYLADSSIDFILLDEITYPINFAMLDIDEVITALQNRVKKQHIVVTGRDMPLKIKELADTITEMKLQKHHFESGHFNLKGIEY